MDLLMLLALPLMMLGGFVLDAVSREEDADDRAEPADTDHPPII